MVDCEFKHEDHCIGLAFDWDCGARGESMECNAKEEDMIVACEMCEVKPADAGFPHDEYCTGCAKELEEE